MSKKTELKPLAAAVGVALAASVFTIPAANAEENPFEITTLSSGYMVAGSEGSCGEGKCGEGKKPKAAVAKENAAKAKPKPKAAVVKENAAKAKPKPKAAVENAVKAKPKPKEGKCGS